MYIHGRNFKKRCLPREWCQCTGCPNCGVNIAYWGHLLSELLTDHRQNRDRRAEWVDYGGFCSEGGIYELDTGTGAEFPHFPMTVVINGDGCAGCRCLRFRSPK